MNRWSLFHRSVSRLASSATRSEHPSHLLSTQRSQLLALSRSLHSLCRPYLRRNKHTKPIRPILSLGDRTFSSSTQSASTSSSSSSSSPPPPNPSHTPLFTPSTLLLFLLACGLSSVLAYDIYSAMVQELAEVQEWRGADTIYEDFEQVTVGAKDSSSPIAARDEEALIKTLLLLPFRALRRVISSTAHAFRAAFILLRFGPLFTTLGVLLVVDILLARLSANPHVVSPLLALEPHAAASTRAPTHADADIASHTLTLAHTVPPSPLRQLYVYWWRLFARALEHSGPTFTKLGQYLSSRPDVLSPGVCALLAGLRDSTEPHAWAETEKTLTEEMGDDWDKYLCVLPGDRTPIGSGCIAQVYKAYVQLPAAAHAAKHNLHADAKSTLHGIHSADSCADAAAERPVVLPENLDRRYVTRLPAPYESLLETSPSLPSHPPSPPAPAAEAVATSDYLTVAIKVLHPHARWTIHRDLRLLHSLACLADSLPLSPFSSVSFRSLAVEFSRLMHAQLDLTQESRNLARFAANFPRPHEGLTVQPFFPVPLCARRRVLIESFHTGIPMATLMRGQKERANRPLEVLEEAKRLGTPADVAKTAATSAPATSDADILASLQANPPPMRPNGKKLCVADEITEEHMRWWRALPPETQDWVRRAAAQCGLDTFLHMLFAHGFFHADLHPGNMLLDVGYGGDQWGRAIAAARNAAIEKQREKRQAEEREAAGENGWLFKVKEWGAAARKIVKDLPEIISGAFTSSSKLSSTVAAHELAAETEGQEWEWDASSLMPSEVFATIHPDDMRLHDFASTPRAAFRAQGLPLPLSAPRLVMLDAGMSTALSRTDQRNFNELFLNVATGRGYEAAALLIERAIPRPPSDDYWRVHNQRCSNWNGGGPCSCGLYGPGEAVPVPGGDSVWVAYIPLNPRQTPEDRTRFVRTVGDLAKSAQKDNFALGGMGVVSTLQSLATAARECGVPLDSAFVSVVIAVTVMEGVGRALDPSCDVLGPAVGIVAKCSVQEAQRALVGMLDGETQPNASSIHANHKF